MADATDDAASILLTEMKRLTAIADHSLKDLADLGHPYRVGAPPNQPHSDWIVHRQSEDLYNGLRKTNPSFNGNTVTVELHSDSDHTWHLILGTPTMRPRDFVSAAIINTKAIVDRTFEMHWARLHDEFLQGGFRLDRRLIDHGAYPAQLPGD